MAKGIKKPHESALPPVLALWFADKGWAPHPHQLAMLGCARAGQSALLMAPTGGGKTLAGFLPTLAELAEKPVKGLHTLYISPLKALAADIHRNLQKPIGEMKLAIDVEMRTGDTSSSRRQRQLSRPPNILLTTPESLELLLSYADAGNLLKTVRRVIIDEVHALAPGKRGHLAALCLSALRDHSPGLTVTGLSATAFESEKLARWLGEGARIVTAASAAPPVVELLHTDRRVPWSGYMGTYAIADIYAAVKRARTCIIFVNTRAQGELLFQQLWEANAENLPIALHHGSLEREHRLMVEALMGQEKLRAIVATASLDLGLDWGNVDLVLQVGAPKSISRLLQRIGRSNHRLDTPSEALLVPCNRFEMIESMAVMQAIDDGVIDGDPLREGTLDVLAQFVMNSACGKGFVADELYAQVIRASPYAHVTRETFDAVVAFVAHGGYALRVYERFQRIELNGEGRWVASQIAARRHRMNSGTIIEYETLRVHLRKGKSRSTKDLGQIEELFIQGLLPGDTFLFAGQLLRFRKVHENRVETEPAKGERPKIPSFKGGRMPLSVSVAERVRRFIHDEASWPALPAPIQEWLGLQKYRSSLPDEKTLLVESFLHEGLEHAVLYTFAGRNANQTLGLLLSHRMERTGMLPLGFVANDYALALWGLKAVNDPAGLLADSLAQETCDHWIESSQMARRAFRDVAIIAGLVERRHPGGRKTGRQVTISTDLIYDVLRKYEPDHILLQAVREDVTSRLADIERLRETLARLPVRHVRLSRVSPLAVPLLLEISIEKIKGEGETALLDSAWREATGDALLKEARA